MFNTIEKIKKIKYNVNLSDVTFYFNIFGRKIEQLKVETLDVVVNIYFMLQYIVERHGKTLLPQYLGMYRLTVDGVEHYMVAMRNVFSNHLKTHR